MSSVITRPNTLKHRTFISCRHFSASLIGGCQNSGRARIFRRGRVSSDGNQRRPAPSVESNSGKRTRRRTDAPDRSGQKSQEIPRFFRVVSTYNQTSDLILIRAAVFWGPRANRGPSMIHARRHESGISPSRASRSGPAVSCFFLGRLTHFLAFWPSLSFLSSVPLCSIFCVSLFPSFLLFWVFLSASESLRNAHLVLLHLFSSFFLPCLLLLLLSSLWSLSHTYISLPTLCFFMLGQQRGTGGAIEITYI